MGVQGVLVGRRVDSMGQVAGKSLGWADGCRG